MPKRYTSRKRTYRKKSRKITRFRRYRTGTRAKAKSYFRLRRAAKNYSKTRKIKRAKKQYKYTAGKGVKNKIRHLSLSEFALLPFYDLARLTATVKSGGSPNMYDNITQQNRQAFENAMVEYWLKYGCILPENFFNTASPFISSNGAFPPYLYAYNPILSPVTCGSKMQLYAALYKKFKYVGIKVTWHPRSQKVTSVVPTMCHVKPSQRPDGTHYQDTYNAYAVNGAVTVPSTLTNPSAVGVLLDPASMNHQVTMDELTVVNTQTLYMHVYFGKQIQSVQYWSMPYLDKTAEDPATGTTTYQVANDVTTHLRDRRFKAAPFYDPETMLPCIERDSKLHKIYDMSRPFSFFVRPMVAKDDTAKEAPTNAEHEFAEVRANDPQVMEELQSGLKHLGYKEFNHALVPDQVEIPQDAYGLAHAHDRADKYYQRWSILNNDDNFFNPIMFWYCFTTSADYNPTVAGMTDSHSSHQLFSTTWSAITQGNNSNARKELSARMTTQSDFLTNYGYFDVTFYTKWKEERPLVSKTSYVGIVPSETGVNGISSILGN